MTWSDLDRNLPVQPVARAGHQTATCSPGIDCADMCRLAQAQNARVRLGQSRIGDEPMRCPLCLMNLNRVLTAVTLRHN